MRSTPKPDKTDSPGTDDGEINSEFVEAEIDFEVDEAEIVVIRVADPHVRDPEAGRRDKRGCLSRLTIAA